MMCSKCGTKMKVLATRHPDKPGRGWEISRARPIVGWYTQDFVVRVRNCPECETSTFTVEVSIEDMKGITKSAAEGCAPIKLIKSR